MAKLYELVMLVFFTCKVRGHFELGRFICKLLWRDSPGRWATAKPHLTLKDHHAGIYTMALNQSEEILASGDGVGFVRFWDTTTGELLGDLEAHGNCLTGLQFSRDGRMLLTSSFDKTVKLWDLRTCALLAYHDAHTRLCNCCAFFRRDTHVLSGSREGSVILANLQMHVLQVFRPHPGWVMALDVSPDSQGFCAGFGDTLCVWSGPEMDLSPRIEHKEAHQWTINTIRYSLDTPHILTGSYDQAVKLWDSVTGEPIKSWHFHGGFVSQVRFLAPTLFASISEDSTMCVWDMDGESALFQHQSMLYALVYCRKTRTLISGGVSCQVCLWKPDNIPVCD